MGLVEPKLRKDGYCSSCNHVYRDIVEHRASQACRLGRSSIRSSGPKGSVAYSAHKAAAARAYKALRAYDQQDDDRPNSAAWNEEYANA